MWHWVDLFTFFAIVSSLVFKIKGVGLMTPPFGSYTIQICEILWAKAVLCGDQAEFISYTDWVRISELHLPLSWPWVGHTTPMNLDIFICKMGLIINLLDRCVLMLM